MKNLSISFVEILSILCYTYRNLTAECQAAVQRPARQALTKGSEQMPVSVKEQKEKKRKLGLLGGPGETEVFKFETKK